MKYLLIIFLLISSVLCSYLDGLERSFEIAEFQMIDLNITIPDSEVEDMIETAQISKNEVYKGKAKYLDDFSYENATLVITFNNEEKTYENVTFATGGMCSRAKDKVGYNFKLNKEFLGRKHFKIRPNPMDQSYLRLKLSCDIANRIGLPSIQATYTRLYINNKYWGLYTLMDSVKSTWIKETFNPKDDEIKTLYQCKYDGMNFKKGTDSLCSNDDDEYLNDTSLNELVSQISNSTTIEDLEKLIDVDVFLKSIAYEWLIGSWDHLLILGHNFYLYRRETDNKWIIIYYDFDYTFGSFLGKPRYWKNHHKKHLPKQIYNYSFKQWELGIPMVKTLVHNNPERFKEIVHEVLVSAFNPVILDEHIDELKEFLLPYVEEDTTPNSDGNLPGRINKKGVHHELSVHNFETNIETKLNGKEGVKSWIKGRFESACKEYGFDKDKIIEEAMNYIPKSYDYGEHHHLNLLEKIFIWI